MQAVGTIEQHVVENDILVVQPDAGTDDCLAVFGRIPSNAQLGSKIRIRLIDTVSPAGKSSIDRGISRQIAVSSTGIVVVPNAYCNREVRLYLPSIPHVEREAMIRTKPAGRKSQRGLKGAEALTIAVANSFGVRPFQNALLDRL